MHVFFIGSEREGKKYFSCSCKILVAEDIRLSTDINYEGSDESIRTSLKEKDSHWDVLRRNSPFIPITAHECMSTFTLVLCGRMSCMPFFSS